MVTINIGNVGPRRRRQRSRSRPQFSSFRGRRYEQESGDTQGYSGGGVPPMRPGYGWNPIRGYFPVHPDHGWRSAFAGFGMGGSQGSYYVSHGAIF